MTRRTASRRNDPPIRNGNFPLQDEKADTMNSTVRQRRIRDYERGLGSCTCESLGVCPLCTAARTIREDDDPIETATAAVTGPWSAFVSDDDGEHR